MKYQIETVITVENSDVKFYVKESVDEILAMIKNTMGDNFITLTLFNHSDVVSGKLYIKAKSIVSVHEEEYFRFNNKKERDMINEEPRTMLFYV